MKRGVLAIMICVLSCMMILPRSVRAENRWEKILDQYQDDENVQQLLFVKYKKKSKAKLYLYEKDENNQWKCSLKCNALVGKNGINKKKEGDMKTPTGTFGFTGAFGIKKNPDAKMNYIRVKKYHYWCSDKKYYNKLIDIRKKKHKCHGEHLIEYKPQYNYGMFIGYNKKCKYKKGSAIFLHCTRKESKYTAGCVAVSQKNMKKILKRVDINAKICIYNK